MSEQWWSQITRKKRDILKYPLYIFIIDYCHNIKDRLIRTRHDGIVNIMANYDKNENITRLSFCDNIMMWKTSYLKLILLDRNLDGGYYNYVVYPEDWLK